MARLSCELYRAYKPKPETYLGAAALLGLKPAETMMVAAHYSDLMAARGLIAEGREIGDRAGELQDLSSDLGEL